jgi:hypothetical protein
MVAGRFLLVSLALFAPLIQAAPKAITTINEAFSTSTTASTTTTTTASTPLCSPEAQGIVKPTPGTIITQTNDGNYGPTYFEVIYCSGQYFKTSSIDGSVLLAVPEAPDNGQLLIKDQAPDNLDAYAGFYSYRFNASISPSDGDYLTGEQTLSIYETTTGECEGLWRRRKEANLMQDIITR